MPHEPQTNPPDDDRRGALARVRRVDWRFLFPDARLGRVAIVGKRSPALETGLEAAAASLGDGADADTVVVQGGPADVRAAAERVRPGGRLYVELPPAPLRSPARVLELLRALGYSDAKAHWHHPDFERCEEIVPLEDDAIVRHALARRSSRLRAGVGRVLLAAGLLERAVPCVSVVARRGPVDEGLETGRSDRGGLSAAGEAVPTGTRALLLTPRFAASRHVIFLLFRPGDGEPSLVAKIPRLHGDVEGISREAAALRAVAGLGTPTLGAPGLVAYEDGPEGAILVETALSGVPMAPALVRRSHAGSVRAVTTLLGEIGVATSRPAGEDPSWFDRLLGAPLAGLSTFFAGHDEARLVARTLELLAPLGEADFPLVLEHGDVGHPNLVVLAGGRAGLIDWELCEPSGLPGHDLFFFLAYAAAAVEKAAAAQRGRVFSEAFFGSTAPYERAVLDYCRQLRVPVELAPRLFLACWARYGAALAARSDEEAGENALVHARVRAHRYYAAWRLAVERFDRIRLIS